jgi:uncharacterized protein (TIGR00661 family)
MKRILIAPLDWGLGHATRCIPIIRYLIEKGCEVVIGADGRPLHLLKKEFPSCKFVLIRGYNISYPKNGAMAIKMVSQIPKILSGIKQEHEKLKKIIKEKSIDGIISDNRFGLWSKEVPCVFITHQLMVKSLFGEKWIHKLNKKYISKYTECWVPDVIPPPVYPSRVGINSFAGDLTRKFPLPENAKCIGILSRFNIPNHSCFQNDEKRQLLVILSGPEPQRTVFEKIILRQLSSSIPMLKEKRVLIVQGVTEKNERRKISENVEMISHLSSVELHKEILSSEIILSRSGYSTIMDLALLSKKAIFVPTPGQTEQEYLSKYYLEKKIAYSVSQKKFELNSALEESEKYSGFVNKYSGEEFKLAVDDFLFKL